MADKSVVTFKRGFDRLFEDFFPGFGGSLGSEITNWGQFSPLTSSSARCDLIEKPDHFEVTADVPGFNKDEVSVDVHHGVLRIHAEKSERKESDEPGKDGVKWHRVERSSSTLSRQFKLPPAADEARISAKAENGVLSVTIPKLEAAAAGAKKVAVA